MARTVPLVHPGAILLEEWLQPLGISQYALAKAIGVRRINEIVHGLRGISADTAVLLGRYFDVPAEGFMNLQAHYDIEQARARLADALGNVTPLAA
jgi:addiction module HigA family antidote